MHVVVVIFTELQPSRAVVHLTFNQVTVSLDTVMGLQLEQLCTSRSVKPGAACPSEPSTSAMPIYLNKQDNYMGDSSRNHRREPYHFSLLVYPFFSNKLSIPCFVLKHLQHFWLDLSP
ncbi:hypothetical protein BDA96_09G208000 [Sorghum bicolor]|uniref:Uncharacterized protein n=2 Tax=Sorghum bicolor TaxID=4558 RepID=A0A1Z5R3F8_SORBI|nr:hypothetical protein BDA96_09G208000 [Sorghum bicolor]OQU78301.1 hypothetical protein SORBI_3009G197350 [Sorghum bicolor]OQU78302.1 hypothetical protein SORBI_3009G197350 [Sorghum bicolor]